MIKNLILAFVLFLISSTAIAECTSGDCENGQGNWVDVGGDQYVGEFLNGRYSGQGTWTGANGDQYVGEFLIGRFNGQGTWTDVYGNKYVGEFLRGVQNGQGIFIWVVDSITCAPYIKSGDKYEGLFLDGNPNGKGTLTKANGDVYVGDILNCKKHGQGTYTYATGRTYAGEFKNDAMVTAANSNVRSATGTAFSLNPINAEIPTANTEIADTGAVFTLEGSSTTIERDDGSVVEIKQKSIVLLNPYVQTSNTITLIRGETTLTVDCSVTGAYEVQTAVANIQVASIW